MKIYCLPYVSVDSSWVWPFPIFCKSSVSRAVNANIPQSELPSFLLLCQDYRRDVVPKSAALPLSSRLARTSSHRWLGPNKNLPPVKRHSVVAQVTEVNVSKERSSAQNMNITKPFCKAASCNWFLLHRSKNTSVPGDRERCRGSSPSLSVWCFKKFRKRPSQETIGCIDFILTRSVSSFPTTVNQNFLKIFYYTSKASGTARIAARTNQLSPFSSKEDAKEPLETLENLLPFKLLQVSQLQLPFLPFQQLLQLL